MSGTVLVDPEVVEALQGAEEPRRRIFVAACAERMAQIFTGVRGSDDRRGDDLDTFMIGLDVLWGGNATVPAADVLSSVESFVEMQPSEMGITDPAEVHASLSVLTMRYALTYLAGHDFDYIVRCGHIALTAMGQMDQNLPDSDLMARERSWQRRSSVELTPALDIATFRQDCQNESRLRLEALLARLRP